MQNLFSVLIRTADKSHAKYAKIRKALAYVSIYKIVTRMNYATGYGTPSNLE